MASIQASVGREGVNRPGDVEAVQSLLNKFAKKLDVKALKVDGVAGPRTRTTIETFQRRIVGLKYPDGRVDPNGKTLKSLNNPPPTGKQDPAPKKPETGAETPKNVEGVNWPPKPGFPPLVSNAQRANIFGSFEYKSTPTPDSPEDITIQGDWVQKNIVKVSIDMGPHVGVRNVRFHRLAKDQLVRLWESWGKAGLLDRVLTYSGAFYPRFIRGSTKTLSNHSYGTAFDINVAWNGLTKTPALVGKKGSVRELVPIANECGFYWGGHFSRLDGMHFEVAKLV